MKELGYYIKYDVKHLFKRKLTVYYLLILLSVALIDTVITYWSESRFYPDKSDLSVTWYVFLENGASIMSGFYFGFLPILSVIPFGLQYYQEKRSHYREYLLTRGGRRPYYLSKYLMSFIVGFLTIFTFLLFNYVMVHLIYPNQSLIGGTFTEPDKGAFLAGMFYENVHLYQFTYILINAFVGGVLSLIALALCMLFSYKNGFLVLAVPFIFYTGQSIALFFFDVHYDLMHIIQPAVRSALEIPIQTNQVVTTMLFWIFLATVLFALGFKKERDIL